MLLKTPMPKVLEKDLDVRLLLRLSQWFIRRKLLRCASLTARLANLLVDEADLIETLNLARLFHQLDYLKLVEKLLVRVWTSRRIDPLINELQMNYK